MVEWIFLRLSPRSHWLSSVMENFSLESRTFQKLRSKGKHWTWSKNCFAALTTILRQQPCGYYDTNIAFTHAIFEAEAISVSYFIDEQHKKKNTRCTQLGCTTGLIWLAKLSQEMLEHVSFSRCSRHAWTQHTSSVWCGFIGLAHPLYHKGLWVLRAKWNWLTIKWQAHSVAPLKSPLIL